MGEGAYIRIQNKSTHDVTISLGKTKGVDDQGLAEIQGPLAPDSSLPKGDEANFMGGVYQYIEGDVRFRFQKDGYFEFICNVPDSSPSSLHLKVDHDEWWCDDVSPDHDSKVKVVADVNEEGGGTFKIEVRIYNNYKPASWMGDMAAMITDTPLSQVGLPGTHDSGTCKFDKEAGASPDNDLTSTIQDKLDKGRLLGAMTDMILGNIFKRLCQCQDKSIKEQLELGIRYLDLRVGFHPESGKFYTCHGVFCIDMVEVIAEINDFMSANPKELVILDFNHLYGMDDDAQHKQLVDAVLAVLGDKVADGRQVNAASTVGEYWAKGYQAVILYCGRSILPDYPGLLWGQKHISSPWPNVNEPDELKTKLEGKIATHDKGRFFVAQGILTPDTELIKKEVLASGGISLKSIANKCSPKVVDWIEDEWKHQPLNICIVDFFENCSLVAAVINYNRK